MGTKKDPGPYDCLANALPDEPYFLLLARDPQAPDLVRRWADERLKAVAAGHRPQGDNQKAHEARKLASRMEHWALTNWPWRKGEAQPKDEDAIITVWRCRNCNMDYAGWMNFCWTCKVECQEVLVRRGDVHWAPDRVIPSTVSPQQRWEYLVAPMIIEASGLVRPLQTTAIEGKSLDQLGREGWELVTVIGGLRFVFKRPVR